MLSLHPENIICGTGHLCRFIFKMLHLLDVEILITFHLTPFQSTNHICYTSLMVWFVETKYYSVGAFLSGDEAERADQNYDVLG